MEQTSRSRVFLGWHKPLPELVTAHLLEHFPDLDLSRVTVLVSGGRVGRRILALLAEAADARGAALDPPRIMTPGELPPALFRPAAPPAGRLLRQLAWAAALRATPPAIRDALFPRLTDQGEESVWQGAAGVLERSNEELGAAGLSLSAAAQRVGQLDSARWAAADSIYQSYLRQLQQMERSDPREALREAMDAGNIVTSGPIVLAGISQLPGQLRQLLERVSEPVTSLIYAPPSLADGFDDFGGVITDFWSRRAIDLDGAKLQVAVSPREQAESAFAALAGIANPLPCDRVTIGAADTSLVPHLIAVAENLGNLPVRYGAGIGVAQTRPYRLLKLAADYLESDDFHCFATLVRHPDVERWLREDEPAREVRGQGLLNFSPVWRDFKSLLDMYAAENLPGRLGPEFVNPEKWRPLGKRARRESEQPRERDDRADLAWLFSRIENLLGDLRITASEEKTRTPDAWAEPIAALLRRVYGRAWDQLDTAVRTIVIACQELRGALDELLGVGEVADASRLPPLRVDEAIGMLLGLADARRVPPPDTSEQIEIVGWLELLGDEAPHLVVTGVNEGAIPESMAPDPLLNETLRQALAIPGDADRLARDAYVLTAITQSRAPGAVTLISGRVSASGDPLLPSRLLFACDPVTMAQRVSGVIKPPTAPPPIAWGLKHGQSSGFIVSRAVRPGIAVPTSLAVTAFGAYLASPRSFYLRHVLKLKTIEQSTPREMTAGQCGDLVHDVLMRFAQSPVRDSTEGRQCADAMTALLDDAVARKFGDAIPGGAIRFQIELLRHRLASFGHLQAAWAAQGWRIVQTEWSPPGGAVFAVDGEDFTLRGSIDRIDYNERTRQWAVLDYKVTSGEKTPSKTHLSRDGWTDLQLPLYRHLAGSILGGREAELGYMVLSDEEDHCGPKLAQWDQSVRNSADETARQVVRDIRQQKFSEIGDPREHGIFRHIFGQDILLPETDDDAPNVPEAP